LTERYAFFDKRKARGFVVGENGQMKRAAQPAWFCEVRFLPVADIELFDHLVGTDEKR